MTAKERDMTAAESYVDQVLDALPRATPRREQIAAELRSNIAERLAAGQPVEAVLAQLGDPTALAESYLSAVPLVSASFGRRAAAKIIDVVGMLAIVAPFALIAALLLPSEVAPFVLAALFMSWGLGVVLYFVAAEAWFGHTGGKYLLGLRVVRESGARISIGQSVVRQLPVLFQVFWIDVLFALFTDRSQRAFELLSKTRVVVAAPPD
jgi:uncharacterized RDD family membrane protein YckC